MAKRTSFISTIPIKRRNPGHRGGIAAWAPFLPNAPETVGGPDRNAPDLQPMPPHDNSTLHDLPTEAKGRCLFAASFKMRSESVNLILGTAANPCRSHGSASS